MYKNVKQKRPAVWQAFVWFNMFLKLIQYYATHRADGLMVVQ